MATEIPSVPQNLTTALLELVEALDRLQLRYALIGGIAAAYHSRPRFTQDIDVLVEIPQILLPRLFDDLHARGFTFDTETASREWGQQHLTVVSFRGVRVDWLKPLIPLFQHVLDQARPEAWLGHTIRIASPEGLILTKIVPFRTQDQLDMENLLAANPGQLDIDWIRHEWQAVADPADPRLQRFNEMVSRHYLPTTPEEPS
ncbi:MAG TPA: hypothetical protein VK395_13500 [Gemmataceae bacterium]|nr:hypothetical protein [Gemmataceae bacterium]